MNGIEKNPVNPFILRILIQTKRRTGMRDCLNRDFQDKKMNRDKKIL